MVNEEQMEHYR